MVYCRLCRWSSQGRADARRKSARNRNSQLRAPGGGRQEAQGVQHNALGSEGASPENHIKRTHQLSEATETRNPTTRNLNAAAVEAITALQTALKGDEGLMAKVIDEWELLFDTAVLSAKEEYTDPNKGLAFNEV